MTRRLSMLLAFSGIALAVSPCRGQRPPSSSEITKWLKAFYALDHRVAADHAKHVVHLDKGKLGRIDENPQPATAGAGS